MSREIKLQEVKKHDNSRSLWMVIHNEVYDVTKFIDEHPGGEESLLEFAGKDGTEAFEDVGHSEDARELLKQYKIGVLPKEERNVAPCCIPNYAKKKKKSMSCGPDEPFDSRSKKQCKSKRTPTPHKCDLLGPPASPRTTGRTNAIVVPRERRRGRGPPCGGYSSPPRPKRGQAPPSDYTNLQMALLALAGALIIGFAIKKYVLDK